MANRSVSELLKHTQRLYADKEQSEQLEAKRTERSRLIASVPDVTITEFYCSCHGDFVSHGGKITFKDQHGQPCAYYVSYGKGYKVGETPDKSYYVCRRKRYITDKASDPYFRESKQLAKQRQQMEIDMLQPDDPRFKKYYGDPYAKFNAQQEAKAKAEWENRRTTSR
jgi:hypothetical protein